MVERAKILGGECASGDYTALDYKRDMEGGEISVLVHNGIE